MNQLATNTANTTPAVSVYADAQAFDVATRMATALSKASLVPNTYQGNISDCMVALELANRIGASPLMVMQNIDIIHGRPAWRSQFLIASINTSGRFKPLRFRMEGDPASQDYGCIAWTTEKGDDTLLEGPKITLAMAKAEGWSTKNGSKWKTMPELMLRYRAAAFFVRLYAPEITMGMHTADEVQDSGMYEAQPRRSTLNQRLALEQEPETETSLSDAVKAADGEAGAITYAEVADAIRSAENDDELDCADDLIGALDEGVRPELHQLVDERRGRLQDLEAA